MVYYKMSGNNFRMSGKNYKISGKIIEGLQKLKNVWKKALMSGGKYEFYGTSADIIKCLQSWGDMS